MSPSSNRREELIQLQVNLFDAPDNGEVVVVACFHTIPMGVPAARQDGVMSDENEADPPPGEQ